MSDKYNRGQRGIAKIILLAGYTAIVYPLLNEYVQDLRAITEFLYFI